MHSIRDEVAILTPCELEAILEDNEHCWKQALETEHRERVAAQKLHQWNLVAAFLLGMLVAFSLANSFPQIIK